MRLCSEGRERHIYYKEEKMRIAIIDSGVDKNNNHLKKLDIQGCSLRVCDGCIEKKDEFSDILGHGTAIFYLINKFTKSDYIYNFKVFFDDMDFKMTELNQILDYVYSNYNFDIINISLGAIYPENLNSLENICKNFYYNKKTIIIAAFENYGAISYPAACNYVLGVSAENHAGNAISLQKGVVNLIGREKYYRVPWVNPEYNIVKGNSFLCAEATGFICKQLKYNSNLFSELNDIFKINSFTDEALWLKTAKRAAVFPFNKEIHSIAANEEMLAFEVVKYYHIRQSGIINKKISQFLPHVKNDKIIENIDCADYNNIDFMILGHCEEVSKMTGIDYKNTIISECSKRNINVYSFDKVDRRYNKVYTPDFSSKNVIHRYGKMYMIRQPIICIIGTSSSQGKYTLQLYFRKRLLETGYRVGQLGTEPESMLFGMDATFPLGYNSPIDLNYTEMLLAVNQMLHKISSKDPELIITGSQAGLLPIDQSNIKYATIRHQIFFQGICPDVIVLCINPYDNMEIIGKTIMTAEGMTNGKVIGIVCFAMDVDYSWRGAYGNRVHITDIKIKTLKSEIYLRFGIEMYMIDKSSELDLLLRHIIDYLAE